MKRTDSRATGETRHTEIIAISSGKGGTGKTLIAASLGYALTKAGHRVLMIDADPGTDGLTLFLLGPDGWDALSRFEADSTYRGVLERYRDQNRSAPETLSVVPREINRKHDHGVIYEALITGRGIYGESDSGSDEPPDIVPRLGRSDFRGAVRWLFDEIRSRGAYDYVLADTRGGFAFESTEVCALADSFIVVTEPDYTSFYQDRNLVDRISRAAAEIGTEPFLRTIIVNKATDGEEKSFRLELEREFPSLHYQDTHAVPLDYEAIRSYTHQLIPYEAAPASAYAQATLAAFARTMRFVTEGWDEETIDKWNGLVEHVTAAAEAARRGRRRVGVVDRLKAGAPWLAAIVVIALAWLGLTRAGDRRGADLSRMLTELYAADSSVTVLQANLRTLYDGGMRQFNGVDLSGWDLSRTTLDSVKLRRADLRGANLEDAALAGALLTNADLRRAVLRNADLTGADLGGADLGGADLTGAQVTLAQLERAFVDDETMLPRVAITQQAPAPDPGEWYVVVGLDVSLELARDAARVADSAGFRTAIYLRGGSYRTVIGPYPDRASARRDSIRAAGALRPDVYIVSIPQWCPGSRPAPDREYRACPDSTERDRPQAARPDE